MWAESGRLSAAPQGPWTRSALFDDCDLLDEIDDTPAQLGIADPHEGLGQCQAIRAREKVRYVGGRGSICVDACSARQVRRALEEEFDRHLQDIGDLLQPAGADA